MSNCLIRSILLVGLVLLSTSQLVAQDAVDDTRTPVPTPAELEPLAGKSEQLFAAEYKNTDASQDLVEKLVAQSESDSIKPVEQYYFLTEALRVATEKSADAKSALYVIDQLNASFQISFWEFANESMKQIAKKAKSEPQLESAKLTIDQLVNQATIEEEYQIARLMISRSTTMTRKLGRSSELEVLDELRQDIGELEKLSKYGKSALDRLAKSPDDKKANLDRGNYLILVKSDFDDGLKHWLKSKDEDKQNIAKAESDLDASDGEACIKVGDLWLGVGKQSEGMARRTAKRRALHWFVKAKDKILNSDRNKLLGKINAIKQDLNIAAAASVVALDPKLKGPVDAALKWIVDHQLPDGGWSFDHTIGPGDFRQSTGAGELAQARNGATGLALMTLIKAGHTHQKGGYKKEVLHGIEFLTNRGTVRREGVSFLETGGTMYSHGIVAQVICELYEKTRDKRLLRFAAGAIRYIELSQDPVGGGWRYRPKEPGDTSVLAWQVRALALAKKAGIQVSPTTEAGATNFLEIVCSDDRLSYGYTAKKRGFSKLTPSALLCRLELGWDTLHPEFIAATETISKYGPQVGTRFDAYFNYHGTLLMKRQGGPEWDKWRNTIHDALIKSQVSEGNAIGSWSVERKAHPDEKGGRLYITTLCTMILLEN